MNSEKRFGVDCNSLRLRIPVENYKKLQELRKKKGMTVTAILNQIVDDYLNNLEEQPKDTL